MAKKKLKKHGYGNKMFEIRILRPHDKLVEKMQAESIELDRSIPYLAEQVLLKHYKIK